MALARFIDRALDAGSVLPVRLERDWFRERLASAALTLEAAAWVEDDNAHTAGYMLAVNLAARLYPRLALAGPPSLRDAAEGLARRINPAIEISDEISESQRFAYGLKPRSSTEVAVGAFGWRFELGTNSTEWRPVAGPAALAAASIGMAELFRQLIRDVLPPSHRRRSRQVRMNIINWEPDALVEVIPDAPIDIGQMHLIGCGAIGQAAAAAMASMPVTGRLVAVDPESVELSNLQRYVLALDTDVLAAKTALINRAFAHLPVDIEEIRTAWGADGRTGPGAGGVLIALDSAQARIEVAGSLPARAYNAFTGVADIGWSRHERFGIEPCLACMYWPTQRAPHRHELIASALGIHPDRALMYLVQRVAVGQPVEEQAARVFSATAEELKSWSQRALLDDLADRLDLSGDERQKWNEASIDALYRDGYCGGALVALRRSGGVVEDAVVPMAPQSVLAGVMLATQAIAACHAPLLALRPQSIEARIDLLAQLPQIVARPRARVAGCICTDSDFGGRAFD